MVEIKFLKELPVRSLNNSKLIELSGADIYVDKDANRFAFFGFKNLMRSPMYSLYLVIKQYDSFGSFIRETKFSLPSIYAPHGKYVTEKPIRISDDCEGCEVYIAYAEFATKQLYQDHLVNKSHLSDFTQDYFSGAPKSVTCSINSNIVIQKEAPVAAQPKVEEKKVEPFKPVEEAKPVTEPEVSKEVAPEVSEVKEEAPEVKEEPAKVAEPSNVPAPTETKVRHFRTRMSRANLALFGVAAVIFVVLVIVLFVIF